MNKTILSILLGILGIALAVFAIDALYLFFMDTSVALKMFHGLHFVIVTLGFFVSYFAYKSYKHILK